MKKMLAIRSKLAIGSTLLASLAFCTSLPAKAGSLFLTGHDIDLHGNADGFDVPILKYLTGKTDLTSVKVSYLYGSAGPDSPPSQGIVSSYNVASMTDAQWAQALTAEVIEIASEISCGGCSITPADIATITQQFQIQKFRKS